MSRFALIVGGITGILISGLMVGISFLIEKPIFIGDILQSFLIASLVSIAIVNVLKR